jgi:hypothetical protein
MTVIVDGDTNLSLDQVTAVSKEVSAIVEVLQFSAILLSRSKSLLQASIVRSQSRAIGVRTMADSSTPLSSVISE